MNKKIFIFVILSLLTSCGLKKPLELPPSNKEVKVQKKACKNYK